MSATEEKSPKRRMRKSGTFGQPPNTGRPIVLTLTIYPPLHGARRITPADLDRAGKRASKEFVDNLNECAPPYFLRGGEYGVTYDYRMVDVGGTID